MDDPLNPTLERLLKLCRMDRTWLRGEGVWLWDEAGRRFLDFYAQYGAVALGHNAPAVAAAVREALDEALPAMVQPYRAPYAVALAAELQRLAPGELSRCVFTTSGAQTVETALKLARVRRGRPWVLAAHGSFHGKTLGALALTGQRQYVDGFGPLPSHVEHVPFGDADALAERLAARRGEVAAFFVEPIQGERGVIEPPAGYLRDVRELCSRHGVALVLDEIQTGLGRTGRLFACEHDGVVPDVLLLAKALGGGLFPLGACLVSAELWDEHFALRHSSTFANNNIACKVGLAVLDCLTRGGLVEAAAQRGRQLRHRLQRLVHRFPRLIADVRGHGLLCALELRPFDADDGYCLAFLHQQGIYAYAVAGAIAELASVLVLPTLGETPVLRLSPPLTISEAEVDQAMDALEQAFARLDDRPTETLLRALGVFDEAVELDGPLAPVALPPRHSAAPPGRFAFLIHCTRPEDVRLTNPCLARLSRRELRRVCAFLAHVPPGIVMRTPAIRSATGATTEGYLLTVPLLAEQMEERGPWRVGEQIRRAVDLAASLGAKVVGLGAYTTPYSRRGRLVTGRGPAITTGSALTAGMTIAAIERAAHERGLDLTRATVAVVGAGGSVGRLCACLLARRRPQRLLLVGNPKRSAGSLRRLAAELDDGAVRVEIGATLDALADCDLIVSASGAIAPILDHAPLRPGTLICDVARPPDTSDRLRNRTDFTIIEGGLVALPDPTLRFGAGNLLGLPNGVQLACFAETMLLSLEGVTTDHGIGDNVPLAEVDAMMLLARRHGFALAPPTQSAEAPARMIDRDDSLPLEPLPWTP
jgi:acetylornithine/succinyldiaminopimelate/putrescine aminotransferase/predicted amino acid dehydrogenase